MREEAIHRFVILLLVLTVGACQRIQPIYSVQGHPVPAASANLAPDQVMQLIVSHRTVEGLGDRPDQPDASARHAEMAQPFGDGHHHYRRQDLLDQF